MFMTMQVRFLPRLILGQSVEFIIIEAVPVSLLLPRPIPPALHFAHDMPLHFLIMLHEWHVVVLQLLLIPVQILLEPLTKKPQISLKRV